MFYYYWSLLKIVDFMATKVSIDFLAGSTKSHLHCEVGTPRYMQFVRWQHAHEWHKSQIFIYFC